MLTPTEPRVVDLPEQPYVGIRGRVTTDTVGVVADRLPEIFAWLAERGAEPSGPPFLKYDLIDMAGALEIEAGVPVAITLAGGGDVRYGLLPAGRYVTVTHTGHPDELIGVTEELLRWAGQRGLTWDMSETAAGQAWACRLERYLTDPAVEPDMADWETEMAFRLAGY